MLTRYDQRQARESALYTSWLAEAHLAAGNIDHGAALAQRTLALTTSIGSARSNDRVSLLRQRLAPHAAVPEAAAFLEHAQAVYGPRKAP